MASAELDQLIQQQYRLAVAEAGPAGIHVDDAIETATKRIMAMELPESIQLELALAGAEEMFVEWEREQGMNVIPFPSREAN